MQLKYYDAAKLKEKIDERIRFFNEREHEHIHFFANFPNTVRATDSAGRPRGGPRDTNYDLMFRLDIWRTQVGTRKNKSWYKKMS